MSTKTTNLTFEAIITALEDEDYNGYGFGTIRTATADPRLMVTRYEQLIEAANNAGWTYDDLRTFVNSREGRWLADCATNNAAYAKELARTVTTKK